MNKFILSLIALFASYTYCGNDQAYWSDYRYEHMLGFEAEGYEMFGFNHAARSLTKITGKNQHVVSINYVVVFDDHYLIEQIKINCKEKTSISTDQYESWRGGPEKHYVVEGGWETIPMITIGGKTDIHYYMYKEACDIKNNKRR